MQITYKFKPNELMKDFRLIGETFSRGSQPTKTMKGKRLYSEIIPKDMETEASEMISKSKYAFTHSLKEDIELTSRQIMALRLLVVYCMAL